MMDKSSYENAFDESPDDGQVMIECKFCGDLWYETELDEFGFCESCRGEQ